MCKPTSSDAHLPPVVTPWQTAPQPDMEASVSITIEVSSFTIKAEQLWCSSESHHAVKIYTCFKSQCFDESDAAKVYLQI